MPRNSLAPGFVKIFQTTILSAVPLDHVQTLGINPSTWSGATTTIIRKSGSTVQWDTALGELIAVMRPLFTASTTFTVAELWRQDTPTSDPLYIGTSAIALAGTGAGSPIRAVQTLFDFKGDDDSDMRFTLIEAGLAADRRLAYTGMVAAEKALVDYVIGATTWLYTRGNAYPANVGLLTSKVNDKVRRERLNL